MCRYTASDVSIDSHFMPFIDRRTGRGLTQLLLIFSVAFYLRHGWFADVQIYVEFLEVLNGRLLVLVFSGATIFKGVYCSSRNP